MVAMKHIREFAEQIADEFEPERIILFGSYAGGQPTSNSDVDLLVVVDHPGKSWEFATRIRNQLRPSFPLDLLVRSPRQIHERLAMGDPFLREITRRGKVLHEADHG